MRIDGRLWKGWPVTTRYIGIVNDYLKEDKYDYQYKRVYNDELIEISARQFKNKNKKRN